MYTVEMILVIFVVMYFLNYLYFFPDIMKQLISINKQIMLHSSSSALLNSKSFDYIYDNNLDLIAFILYNSLSNLYNEFSQKITYYDTIYINNNTPFTCIAFLYNFPQILNAQYMLRSPSNNSLFFMIENNKFSPCYNFTATNDWHFLVINYYPYNESGTNISIYIPNSSFPNVYPDPYSIFIYDVYGRIFNINYVSYQTIPSYNIINISFTPIYSSPIIIVLRLKENSTYPDLKYLLMNRYKIVDYIPNASIVNYSYYKSNWLTIYISNQCFVDNYLHISYNIPPNIFLPAVSNFDIPISLCTGDIQVRYLGRPIVPEFYPQFWNFLKVTNNPTSSLYRSFLIFNKGSSFIIYDTYGS